nr:anhydro-N-acetylmuramic acid kinase [Bacteroidota bacterium]
MKQYYAVGLMSGTSLDGCDAALCKFTHNDQEWSFEIIDAKTYNYDNHLQRQLHILNRGSAEEFAAADAFMAHFFADCVNDFLKENKLPILCIGSHGHTVFHKPQLGYTTQIGNGAIIAAGTQQNVVCDFRSMDVALGGQGAPLVPVGDALLFGDNDACLNLGGIANISYQQDNTRLAYDICHVNMVFNYFARKLGKQYDSEGLLARNGALNQSLLAELEQWNFYSMPSPKSLGKETFDSHILPMIEKYDINANDVLHTWAIHASQIISNEILKMKQESPKILVTGGGAYNTFFIEKINQMLTQKLIIPSKEIIEYKEALVFAFLGVLRMLGKVNVWHSVTGSAKNHSAGAVYRATNINQ